MPKKMKLTPEQEKRVAEIHAELAAQKIRYAEIERDTLKLNYRNRELFLELAAIGRTQS